MIFDRIVLGIDASLTATGLAVYDPRLSGQTDHYPYHLSTWTLTSDSRLNGADPVRWGQVINQIKPYLRTGAKVYAAIEGLFPTTKGNSHDWLVGLRSVLIHELHQAGADWVSIASGTMKVYATGSGRVEGKNQRDKKAVVLRAIRDRYGHILTIANHNEGDAFTLLAMTLHHYGRPIVPVPDSHSRALATPEWPVVLP